MTAAPQLNPPHQQLTLREEMLSRAEDGDRFRVYQIVSIMVPFITDLAERHARGEALRVHPSAIIYHPDGARLRDDYADIAAHDRRDHACFAPEARAKNGFGDARASVFSVGAILFEMATGQCVGPGMPRPSEVAGGIPVMFDTLLSKALVGAPEHRPADLGALAQALHHCAPKASIPPPPADESHLDAGEDFDIDVSLSLIPPPPNVTGPGIPVHSTRPQLPRAGAAAVPQPSANGSGSTAQLSMLKAQLESDPRPRYVVIKDGMDHGPFNAVELLQQIASHNFLGEHVLRDTLSAQENPIDDWNEFAPFARHAHLNRQATSERKALDKRVEEEQHNNQWKVFAGAAVFVLFGALAAGWWVKTRQDDQDDLAVTGDKAQSIHVKEGLSGKKGQRAGGSWKGGSGQSQGAHPVVPGGLSCAGARARYVEDYSKDAPPDLSAGHYGAVLNRGTYLNSCGVPASMTVSICAAVQNGRAVGVTVSTVPKNRGISSCVSSQIRGMSFPSHPRLDITTTVFKGQ